MRSFYVLFLCALFMCSFIVLFALAFFMRSFYVLFLCAFFIRLFDALFSFAILMCSFHKCLAIMHMHKKYYCTKTNMADNKMGDVLLSRSKIDWRKDINWHISAVRSSLNRRYFSKYSFKFWELRQWSEWTPLSWLHVWYELLSNICFSWGRGAFWERKKGSSWHIRTTGNDRAFMRTITVMSRMRNWRKKR